MAEIQGNKIKYAAHFVVFDHEMFSKCTTGWAAEYMQEMADSLSPEGSALTHEEELEALNNDGSWTIENIEG